MSLANVAATLSVVDVATVSVTESGKLAVADSVVDVTDVSVNDTGQLAVADSEDVMAAVSVTETGKLNPPICVSINSPEPPQTLKPHAFSPHGVGAATYSVTDSKN
jgi:hypothetical protein